MAWTTPRTWTPGETVTATIMNTHVRDNLTWLREAAWDPYLWFLEDFAIGNTNTNYQIGALGWIFYSPGGGTTALGTEGGYASPHPGTQIITCGTTAGVNCLYLHGSVYGVCPRSIGRMDADVIVPSTWPATMSVAFLTTSVASITASACSAIRIEADSGDTNWYSVTSDGSSETRKDTGVAVATNTWFNLEVRNAGAQSWDFYVNGVYRTNHTGAGENVPSDTAACEPGTIQNVSGGSAVAIRVDRVRAWTVPGDRFD